jgi:exodeoxyribonuclease V beta subunit
MSGPATVRYRFPAELRGLGSRHAVVEASAGTGKTYILEHLVVDLILRRDLSLEQILVVTFTEKATAELAQRLRRKLHELRDLRADHPGAAGAADQDCWLIDERARRKLEANLHAFDRASISTIHAFCQRVLGEHAFFNRRLFAEEIIDEEEAFKTAFADTLRRDVVADPTLARLVEIWVGVGQGFARLQRAVLRALHGLACLHPARPGSLRPGPLDEGAVLAAARTLAAAGDPARLKEALARHKVHPSTAKSVLSKLADLCEAAAACRETAQVPLLLATVDAIDKNRDGALEFVRGHLEKYAADPALSPLARAYAGFFQQAVPLMGAVVGRLAPLVAARLESHKRQAGLFDFQDMLTLTARSLEGEGAGARALLASLRDRYRQALIDEFQDTDEVQWSIFRRIFFESRSGHVLTVIGDPKQAIYAFRGADVHTYLRARGDIEAAGGARLHLQDNFRSSAPLIEGYNAILDQAAPFFRPEGGILYDHPVRCGRPDPAGDSGPALVVFDLQTQAKDLLTWQVKRSLLARIATEIARQVRGEGEGGGGRRPGDIFVLCRTTRECREVGDALRAVGVPHAFYKQERLFATIEAREVLDLLRAIADPDDVTARGRAFITPFFGLSLTDLAACDDLDGSHPLLRMLYEWRALAEAGDFETLFARVVDESGIVCREVFWNPSERALTNYLHLLELLQEEAARSRATIRELAQTLGAYIHGTRRPPGDARDLQRLETDADAVQIMTIHHAKGLEAEVVFLYGGFWPGPPNDVRTFHEPESDRADAPALRRVVRVGRLPSDERDRHEAEQNDEERRVLYVALTRARKRLYLPRFPAAFRQLRGCYRFVNERLDQLFGGFTPPEVRALFQRVPVSCPEEALPPLAAPPSAAVAAWTLPADLFEPAADPTAGKLAALAASRAGFLVTSYSAVKRFHPGAPAAGPGDSADPTAEQPGDEREAAAADLPERELPRGRLTGRFLHEVIEELSLPDLRGQPPPPLAAWAARPEVEELFERKRQRHDRSREHLPHARELIHAALTSPLALGDRVLPGLAGAERALREVEFYFPIPEQAHQLLAGEAAAGPVGEGRPFRIERGVVKGFIDFLFEDQGRTYVCDWKGDWLADWEQARLASHCAQHYGIQMQLYTLATLRLLGVDGPADYDRRFGGVLFCFLRGMTERQADTARGVQFSRPTWDQVLAWQRAMLGDSFWGLS